MARRATKAEAAAKKWMHGIERPIRWQGTATATLVPLDEGSPAAREAMREKVMSEEFWLELLDTYMAEILIPEMSREWKMREGKDIYYPQTIESTSTSDIFTRGRRLPLYEESGEDYDEDDFSDYRFQRRARRRARLTEEKAERTMQGGMRELFSALTKKVIVREGQYVGRGLGPMREVLRFRLSRYMPFIQREDTRSRYNTLWYAVEFGTGMLAGSDDGTTGSPYVRTVGVTKDKKHPGAWWVPKRGMGILWKGQAGFHFLHDARTREPKEKWKVFLRDSLLAFISKYVAENAPAFEVRT